ncbi:hypothetical protein SGUI_0293 [Serinicoccus hydrothermalis]|uniref:VOC domain-containing protein n=2 Tax=Serinicoccus hydrothermalis TaxID=1758689 RepID=A0A1B1N8E1_9MICO|nr:hypothetical protein SGUI_0293 [Serinicoccus hydrothermalis]
MDITRDISSVTVVVEDLDRALAFYRDVLGCEVRTDTEPFPGVRMVEVAPPGSAVGVALLTREGGLPLGVRYWIDDADLAHRELREAGVHLHEEVLRLEGMPPMFTFDDSEGNTVILLERDQASAAVTDVVACLPVSDLDRAAEFYRAVLGREPDARPMPGLAEWHDRSGSLQVTLDERRAGGGLVTITVTDLRRTAADLAAAGVELEVREGTAVAGFASVEDPDGNLLTLVQAAG